MDYNQTDLKQLPITPNIRKELFTPFSTSFFYNQTSRSIKCNSSEEWAEKWIDVSDLWKDINVPCSTNDSLVAYFEWDGYEQKQ